MSDRIRSSQFHDAAGAEGWRVVFGGACAYFRTGSFATGVALVEAIGGLAETADRHPDVDLRPEGVTVRLRDDVDGLRECDVALARRISAAAGELGVPADPAAVQTVQVAIDALVSAEVMPFWRVVLGYEQWGEEDVVDPRRRGPSLWFQRMGTPRPQRNRIHVDVCVAPEEAEPRVAAALAAGGRLVADHAPQYWTLADAEGNEVDVTSFTGRD